MENWVSHLSSLVERVNFLHEMLGGSVPSCLRGEESVKASNFLQNTVVIAKKSLSLQ